MPTRKTSIQALKSVLASLNEQRRIVANAIRRSRHGLTDEELGLPTWLDVHHNALRARRGELVKMGLVRDSGRTRKTRSGRAAIVWEINPEYRKAK